MFKTFKTAYEILPNTYTYFASSIKLSDKRKSEIEERRGRLKAEENEPEILHIVIGELLAYKPGLVTLDDRYLQLESILDAVDKAKMTKQIDHLIRLCREIEEANLPSFAIPKNCFLERLQSINLRVAGSQGQTLKARL